MSESCHLPSTSSRTVPQFRRLQRLTVKLWLHQSWRLYSSHQFSYLVPILGDQSKVTLNYVECIVCHWLSICLRLTISLWWIGCLCLTEYSSSSMPLYTLTLTLSHTLTITCTCTWCYVEIKGTQDLFSCSFSDSLSDWLPNGSRG